MELFRIGFLTVTLADLFDITLVSFIFYRLYIWLRGSIAAQIFVGLVLIVVLSFIVQAANLRAMTWILRTLTDIWVIAFIILFQPELRRLLVLIARSPAVRLFIKTNVEEPIDEVVGAASELSRKKQGALMVFVRTTGIKITVETGTQLDAVVSRALLLSIFNPRSPLHDGAVVIKDRIVEAARCTLPLSAVATWEGHLLGTRHRAGLGISEQADVVVLIVSGESGIISLAEKGVLTRGLTTAQLRKELKERISFIPQRPYSSVWKQLGISG
jgi:diadenylate cyclase